MPRSFQAARLLCLSLASLCLLASDASAQEAKPEVELQTTEGTIVIELDPEKAPKTVENFLQYVNSGFYDGTIFHRVIKDFMIQGGGHEKDLTEKEKTRPPVVNEAGNGLSNKEYTIAMARTPDPDSATSQFFINTKDNPQLNRNRAFGEAGYTVFGRVVKGLDVVDRIEATETSAKPSPEGLLMRDVPVKPVVIEKASVRNKK